MTTRLTDDERTQIIDVLTETESVAETARRTGRSSSTVSRIGRDAGLDVAARANTKRACEANRADNAARRAELCSKLLDDAERLRLQLFAPAVVHSFGGRENTYAEHRLPEPTFADKRNIVASVRMLATTAVDLDRYDDRGEADYSDVDRWVVMMVGAAA